MKLSLKIYIIYAKFPKISRDYRNSKECSYWLGLATGLPETEYYQQANAVAYMYVDLRHNLDWQFKQNKAIEKPNFIKSIHPEIEVFKQRIKRKIQDKTLDIETFALFLDLLEDLREDEHKKFIADIIAVGKTCGEVLSSYTRHLVLTLLS